MRFIGSAIIGVVTAIAGYPVYSFNSSTFGFSLVNTFVCIGCIILWNIIWSKIESKN
jgi:hypothetical protein